MKTLQFKTNIKCGGCIATVTPYLNALSAIEKWEVNTNSPDKLLTIAGEQAEVSDIQEALQKAGYQATLLP